MALLHYLWSRTAASNSTADSNVNWAEGQAPSSVNDSARAMMASLAGYRDDIAGAIATGGTSTAYTVTSYQVFDTLAHMSGQMIAFTPHATNGATVTLNVDGLGAKPLRSAPSVELIAGTLVAGTPYTALYNNSDAAFYLHNFFGANPYNIPVAGVLPYYGPSAPNSSFALPYGQAISRSTYALLFATISTTYGAGDGSTTFNIPDIRGRVLAGADNMGGVAASRLTSTYLGANGTLGNAGGTESKTLITGNLPAYTPAGSVAVSINPISNAIINGTTANVAAGGNAVTVIASSSTMSPTGSGTFTGTAQGGTSTPFASVQPTIICNYIMRVI